MNFVQQLFAANAAAVAAPAERKKRKACNRVQKHPVALRGERNRDKILEFASESSPFELPAIAALLGVSRRMATEYMSPLVSCGAIERFYKRTGGTTRCFYRGGRHG